MWKLFNYVTQADRELNCSSSTFKISLTKTEACTTIDHKPITGLTDTESSEFQALGEDGVPM